jgi:hypothetical protein
VGHLRPIDLPPEFAAFRFTPKADKRADVLGRPLCANSGLMHRNKRYLFDDFVGTAGQG